MSEVKTIATVQPSELNTAYFEFDSSSKTWKIKSNVLTDQSTIKRYNLVQDNATRTIKLYEYTGEVFQSDAATLITTVSMVGLDAKIDDISVEGTVVTFTDANKPDNNTLRIDFGEFIKTVTTANSQAITVSGDGKTDPLTFDLRLDPAADNMLSVGVTGLKVSRSDLLAVLKRDVAQIMAPTIELDETSGKLKLNVNGSEVSSIKLTRLVNSAGDVLGYLPTA